MNVLNFIRLWVIRLLVYVVGLAIVSTGLYVMLGMSEPPLWIMLVAATMLGLIVLWVWP